jgi:hypothetical protein
VPAVPQRNARLENLYREFNSKGLVVLAVSNEKREIVEKFLTDKNALTFRAKLLFATFRKSYHTFRRDDPVCQSSPERSPTALKPEGTPEC